jgi:hypothetical protein
MLFVLFINTFNKLLAKAKVLGFCGALRVESWLHPYRSTRMTWLSSATPTSQSYAWCAQS